MAGLQNKEILDSLVELFSMLDGKIKAVNTEMIRLEGSIKAVNNASSGTDAKALVENTKKLNEETAKLTELEKAQLKIKQAIESANVKLIAAQSEEAKQLAKINEQTIIQNKQNKLAAQEILGQVGAYKKLATELNNARNKYKDLAASEQEATKEGKALLAQITQMDAKIKRIDASVGQFQRSVGNYGSAFTKLGKDLVSNLGFVGGMTALVAVMKDAFQTIKTFQNEVAKLSAITGASGQDLKKLTDNAKEMSAQFGISATEIVKAYTVIGSQMPELLRNADALAYVTDKVLTLSQATGMDLTQSASAVTSVLNQFGLSAEYAGQVINSLAAGSLEGSAEVNDITESLKNFGTVAKDSNLSVEQSIALLEVLAEKQIRGAEAGTKARGVLLKLKEAGLGYQSGIFNLNDATAEYNKNLNKMGTELEKDAYAQKIFGTENITVGKIITQNTEKFNDLTDKVTGTNVAYEQQRKIMNTLQGDINRTKSAWENFILTFSDSDGIFTKVFRSFTQGLGGITDNLTIINTSSTKWYEKLIAVEDILGTIIPGMSQNARELRKALDIEPKITIPTSEIEAAKLRGIKAAQDLYNAEKNLKEKAKQQEIQRQKDINDAKKGSGAGAGKTSEQILKEQLDKNLKVQNIYDEQTKIADKQALDAEQMINDASISNKIDTEQEIYDIGKYFRDLEDEEKIKAFDEDKERQDEMIALITDSAAQLGQVIGEMAANGELTMKEFLRQMLLMTIASVQNYMRMLYVEIIGKQVATKGVLGFATGGVMVASLETLFAVAKQKVQNFAEGTNYVDGPGTETSDSIPVNLSKGEGVSRASINKQMLQLGVGVNDPRLPGIVANGLINTAKMEGILEEVKYYNKMSSLYLSNGGNSYVYDGYVVFHNWRTGETTKMPIRD